MLNMKKKNKKNRQYFAKRRVKTENIFLFQSVAKVNVLEISLYLNLKAIREYNNIPKVLKKKKNILRGAYFQTSKSKSCEKKLYKTTIDRGYVLKIRNNLKNLWQQ